MRRLSVLTAAFVMVPAFAFAHVTVAPRVSKPGAEEKYTVRVPTEGTVPTTSVYLEVPEGVTVTDVPHPEGATHDVNKVGDRIVGITWTKEIPPKQRAEFIFTAKNPTAEGQIIWKIQQRYAEGKPSDWTPGTTLTNAPPPPAATAPTAGHQGPPATSEAAVIEKWLTEYDAAFNAKDLEKLATFYHADVTIYEGGGINNGWADYRDRHLGPELKAFQNLQFGHSNTKVTLLPGGRSAYATSEYSIKAKMGDRDLDSRGLETLVLIKGEDDAWKIRHSHTSSRPRRPAGE
jgi:ketosteroid isomerase-like protein